MYDANHALYCIFRVRIAVHFHIPQIKYVQSIILHVSSLDVCSITRARNNLFAYKMETVHRTMYRLEIHGEIMMLIARVVV